MNKVESGKISFIDKLKKIKGFEYVIVGVLCLLVIVIYFFSSSKSSDSYGENLKTDYASELENRLCQVLSKVEGAGQVNVMITLESNSEIVYATQTEEKTNSSNGSSNQTQSTTKVESPVVVNNSPLVVMEYLPKVRGVIVVAQGANSIKVKLNLLKAVQTIIDVDADSIEILAGI